MKKLTALFLSLLLIVSIPLFVACNSSDNGETEGSTTEATTAATTQATQATTQQTTKPTEAPQNKPEPEVDLADMLIDLMDVYSGKNVSVFGDSISTYRGISNGTQYNTTIGQNAVYYEGSNCGVTDPMDTYWGKFTDGTFTKLCVNNAWSGDALRSLRFLNRAVNLHNNTGDTPVNPDIILVYFGINDIWSNENTPSRPCGNLNDLVRNRGTKTVKEVVESWFAGVLEKYENNNISSCNWDEYYALMLYLMTTTYPDAKIVCIGLTMNAADSYSNDTVLVPQYNEAIVSLTEYFGTLYADQMSVINESNYHLYMGDGARLHPNEAGHQKIYEQIIKALYEDFISNQ